MTNGLERLPNLRGLLRPPLSRSLRGERGLQRLPGEVPPFLSMGVEWREAQSIRRGILAAQPQCYQLTCPYINH